jgi:hypothetical protein
MTSPVANLGVVFFCAAVFGVDLTPDKILVGGFVAIAISIGSVGSAGRDFLHCQRRADLDGDGRADRTAGHSRRGRVRARHLPHSGQRVGRHGRHGDRGEGAAG